MFDVLVRFSPAVVLLAYPIYLLVMAAVLAACGVSRQEIAKWALKQADRQRLIDLVRAARGVQHSAISEESTSSKRPSVDHPSIEP
jgi:hypothetical protein